MPVFNVAWRTRRGTAPFEEEVLQVELGGGQPARMGLVVAYLLPLPSGFSSRTRFVDSDNLPSGLPDAPNLKASLNVELDPRRLSLSSAAALGVLHYFRFADGAVKPLPARPGPLAFAAGDAYVALTPGVRRLAGSPALARFLHLRDDFNAETLAEALLAHLVELAKGAAFPEAVTALVVEAR
ncbi:MAG: hypothetical protein ACRDH2_07640 [Anaerolineales bacterium]